MFTLRKPESEERYQREKTGVRACPFCKPEKILAEWKYWILLENDYPYDAVSVKHDLLVLKEHKSEVDRNAWIEFDQSKYALTDYHCIIENLPQRQSVPGHFHYHLLRYKP